MPEEAFSTELRFAGFLPKRVMTGPDSLECPAVVDVCSLSHCMSPPPRDWIHHWLHGDLLLSDTPEIARRLMDASGPYTLFGYRLSTTCFTDGLPKPWAWQTPKAPVEAPPGYSSLGFDVFGKPFDWGDISGFGCSPLSCNGLASEYPVNAHCLLDDFELALRAAERFSIEQPEPGTYYVAEVLVDPAGVIATTPSRIP